MQSKILSKRTLLLVVILSGLTLFIALLLNFIPQSSSQNSSLLLTANLATLQERANSDLPTGQAGLPARLKIPTIGVDAAVEYVGLTSDKTMDVPKNPTDVAWFELGPRPGEIGGAVIAGHYGGKKTSAFDNLYKLRKGDKIYIEDDQGVIISFVVRETRRYDPSADASYVFGSNDGKSHLNLITCEGEWDKVSKTYSQRLVVFTDKE
ncbi:MAG: class F sortase [bacterium]|nr:class F sortase [bacterium]